VLRPAGDVGLDAGLGQGRSDALLGVGDEALAVGALLVEQAGDAAVGLGLQVAEGEVLQLPLELPDAQPVGQRRTAWGGGSGWPVRQFSGRPKEPNRCSSSMRRRMTPPKDFSIASPLIAPDSTSG
jgi:hypothetical protein